MEGSLLNKVTTENLDKLHEALCDVLEEMNEAESRQAQRLLVDEEYVKCLTLAAKVLRTLANKQTK